MPVPSQTAQNAITPAMQVRWNKLIDFAKAKGYSGMPELDHNPALRQKVFDEYNKANPDDTVPISMVADVQREIQNIRNKSLAAMQSGKYAAAPGVNPNNFMSSISKIDNIFGSKTSSWKFPSAYVEDKKTGDKKNVGFTNKVDLLTVLNK